jgi:hypothetical protein
MVRDAHAVEVLEEDAIVRAIVPDEEALLTRIIQPGPNKEAPGCV